MVGQGRPAGAAAPDRAAEDGRYLAGSFVFSGRAEAAIDLVVEIGDAIKVCRMNGLAIGDDGFAGFGEGQSCAFAEPAIQITSAGEDVAQGQKADSNDTGVVAKGRDGGTGV